jgi:hypothetical protein
MRSWLEGESLVREGIRTTPGTVGGTVAAELLIPITPIVSFRDRPAG